MVPAVTTLAVEAVSPPMAPKDPLKVVGRLVLKGTTAPPANPTGVISSRKSVDAPLLNKKASQLPVETPFQQLALKTRTLAKSAGVVFVRSESTFAEES